MTRRFASFRSPLVLCAALVAAAAFVAPFRAGSIRYERSARAPQGGSVRRRRRRERPRTRRAPQQAGCLPPQRSRRANVRQLRPGVRRQLSSTRGTSAASRSGTSPIPLKPTLADRRRRASPSRATSSIYGHLLFVSAENTGSRLDCGTQGMQDTRQQGAHDRRPHLRRLRIRGTPSRWPTCRPAAARTPTRSSPTRTIRASSTSTSRGSARVRSTTRCRAVRAATSTDPNTRAVPHRGHSRSARAPRAGEDRELAAHLQRSHGAADAWRRGGRHGERRGGRGGQAVPGPVRPAGDRDRGRLAHTPHASWRRC